MVLGKGDTMKQHYWIVKFNGKRMRVQARDVVDLVTSYAELKFVASPYPLTFPWVITYPVTRNIREREQSMILFKV